MYTKSVEERILIAISAIADCIGISSIFGIIVKDDLPLKFLMTVAAIFILGVAYRLIRTLPSAPVVPPTPGPRPGNSWRTRIRVPVLIASVVSVVLAIGAGLWLTSSEVTPLKVTITDPQDRGNVTVPRPYLAMGTVSDPNARVYVIVRTLPVRDKWVQQPAIVDGEGNWQTSVYFGDETINSQERYEAIAIATSDNFLVTWATGNSLSEGQRLLSLPSKSNKSSLITVTRPK